MAKILNPLSDLVFKRIFGNEKEILIEFINNLIDLINPVVSIEFIPLELLSENQVEKSPVVDVRCRDTANRQFIVEIQLSYQANFLKRTLFYLSKAYGRQLIRGFDYQPLEPVYLISILNFPLFPEIQDFYQSYRLRSDQHHEMDIEGFHLIFMELPKLKKNSKFIPETLRDFWILFLTEPEKLLNMKASDLNEYPNLLKAVELLDESKYTASQLAAYDHYLDNIRTWNSVMITNYDKGLVEGMEKGLEKGKIDGIMEERNKIMTIMNLLEKREKSPEKIAEEFNEPIEFVLKLNNRLLQ
jgi:predicted transposase/invertase (TIGR01784 family)